MLLPKNGILLECTQPYCVNNGIFQTPVAMTKGYISNIPRCHDDGIYLIPVAMTTGYIRYIHPWFPLILSAKVAYVCVCVHAYRSAWICKS